MLILIAAAVLSTPDLAGIADAARTGAAARAADPFMANAPVIGAQAFLAEAPLIRGDVLSEGDGASGGYWTYDAAAQRLRIVVRAETTAVPARERLFAAAFTIRGARSAAAPFEGENAYGARRMVTPVRWTLDGIEAPNDLRGETDLAVGPEEARAIVAGLTLRISGVTRPWEDGAAVRCGDDAIAAEIDRPTEIRRSFCVVGAALERLEVVSGGRILRSWAVGDLVAP